MTDLFLINPSYIDYGRGKMSVWNFYSLFEIMPPLGITYVAASAINAGYNIRLIDMEAEATRFGELAEIIKKARPKLVGISCTSPLFNTVVELSKIIKSVINVPIIVGGPHTLIDSDGIMKTETIDYCVRGEADFTIVSLLDHLLKGENKIEEIKGVSYRSNGIAIHNKQQEQISDLNRISFPARQLLKHTLYYHPFIKGKSCSSIITTRGCPFSCIFCFQMSRNPRRRSVENVILEIKESKDKYNIKDFEFFDETFNLDRQWVIELCSNLVKQGLNIRWRARCRPEFFTREVVQSMKKAGCYMISMGVESANNRTLEWLNKKYTIEEVVRAIDLIASEKIGLHGYFILGCPVETREDMLRTIDFACTSGFDFATFSILAPLPGTELLNIALREGYLDNFDRNDYSNYIGVCKTLLKHPTMSREGIQSVFKYAYRKFYFRRGGAIKLLRKISFNMRIYCKILARIFKTFAFIRN